MIRHLFKLIWNKRRENILLTVEILISFLIMFAIFTLLVSNYKNYNKPRGFEYENAWLVRYTNPWQNVSIDSANYYFENLKLRLTSIPGVESVSFFANNFPYSGNKNILDINYLNENSIANFYSVDDNFDKIFKINIRKGRWFSKADLVERIKPVIISESTEEDLFKGSNSLGKVIKNKNEVLKVVGVVGDLKEQGDYKEIENNIFLQSDSSSLHTKEQILLLSVKKDAGTNFEESIYNCLDNYFQNNEIKIDRVSDLRIRKNNLTLIPIVILLIIAGFLIFNVALGLFGVLWFNINKRKSEIALRIAIGASKAEIMKQIVAEAMVITTFSLIIGSFIALQFPLLNVFNLLTETYLYSFVISIMFIYVVIFVCALYPGHQAAKIYPANTLHED